MPRFIHRLMRLTRRFFSRRLSDDEQWNAWQVHITRIFNENVYAFESRHIYLRIIELFSTNAELQAHGTSVYDWLRGIYGRDQAIAVRRELDRDSEVLNLLQLVIQISKRPEVISRVRYRAHFSGTNIPIEKQDEEFTELAGSGPYIDPAIVRADRNKIQKKQCARVVKYANRMIAHRTDDTLELTYRDLHDAMDAIEDMFKRYYVLLTGNSLQQFTPIMDPFWERAFTIPWQS